ncbi:MAG: two pore domain potassium channel family protein, partial [Dokdonella sp.]
MASTATIAEALPIPGSGYDNWGVNLSVVVVTLVVLSACVLLHYECLSVMSRRFARPGKHRRRRVLFGIFSVILLHVTEIWIFGIAYFLLLLFPGFGEIHGVAIPSLLD